MVQHPSWTCITPRKIEDADVTIYYRKTAPFRVIPLTHHELSSEQVLPVRITLADDDTIIIIAIYNSPTTNQAALFLQEHDTPEEPIILCGDFNLHSPDWDNTVARTDEKTNAFQDWLTENSFQVLNDPDKPTYHGHRFQYAKVDDLVIANLKTFEAYDIGPIQVTTDNHFASDHYPIEFTIFTTTEAPTLLD